MLIVQDQVWNRVTTVSYTHLDVYKRQVYTGAIASQKKDYRFKIGIFSGFGSAR